MKLEQLKVLDAVVKAGSFARAGQEILLMSQPAVSTAMRKLEQDLGFAIFDRSQYRAQLTPAGQSFYRKASQLLEQASHLEQFSHHLATGVEPELRIAFDQGSLGLRNLKVFREHFGFHAQTRFHFHAEMLGYSIDRLVDGEVDLAICPWLPGFDSLQDLESHSLAYLKLSTMVSPCYPPLEAFKHSTHVNANALKGCVQIITRSSERFVTPGGFGVFKQTHPWYVTDNSTKKLLIQGGLGFGILHHYEVVEEVQNGQLRPFIELENYRIIESNIRMVRHKYRPRGPVQESLWEALKKEPVFYDDSKV